MLDSQPAPGAPGTSSTPWEDAGPETQVHLSMRMLAALPDGVCLLADNGRVLDANPAACALHGCVPAAMVGSPYEALFAAPSRPAIASLVAVLRAGGTRRLIATAVRPDGVTWEADLHGRTLIVDGRAYILLTIRDVTEQAHAQALLEQGVEARTRELTSLLELAPRIASTLDLRELLGLLLGTLKQMVDYAGASLYLREDEYFVLYDHHGQLGGLQRLAQLGVIDAPRVRIDNYGPGWDVYRAGQAVIIDDVLTDDTPIARFFRAASGEHLDRIFGDMRSWMGVPLRFKEEIVGLLQLTATGPRHFTPYHATLALSLATQAAVAVENARLYTQAQELAAVEERQRLARELHDSVAQALFGIGLGVRTARVLLDRDPRRAAETLDNLLTLAQTGQAEMRALLFELRPDALAVEGLVAALQRHVAAVEARHELSIATQLPDEPVAPLSVKEALYRIAQEALYNTIKHAQATHISLSLAPQDGGLALEVADDGLGFDPRASFPGHLGLHTMRERATRFDGTLAVESAPGAGTRVRAWLPAPSQA